MKIQARPRLLLTNMAAAGFVLVASGALAQDALVHGDDNPNLAGRAGGYSCCSGDSVPDQAPELTAADFGYQACDKLGFSATGRVDFAGGTPTGNNPDGDDPFSMTNFGDGISAPKNVRANALVGVFLGDESPTGQPTPPQLDFADGLDFQRLEPEVGQIFFIGNGRTADTQQGDYGGDLQDFVVPHGATRLFLGTADGVGWFNNTGSFVLSIGLTPYEPDFECGDAAMPSGIVAGDALAVLRCAVGSSQVCTECINDVDRSGTTVAGDALRVLRKAVGQNVVLSCPCCPELE